MLAQASRNGYYFLLDRITGESLLSAEFGPQNWSAGLNRRGEPIPKPDKEPQISGTLFEGSGTNWWSPSFSPDTGLFYVNAHHHFMVSYLTLDDQDEQGVRPPGRRESRKGCSVTVMLDSFFGVHPFVISSGLWAKMRPGEINLYVFLMKESERRCTRLLRATDAQVAVMGIASRTLCNARKKLPRTRPNPVRTRAGQQIRIHNLQPQDGTTVPRGPPNADSRSEAISKEGGPRSRANRIFIRGRSVAITCSSV